MLSTFTRPAVTLVAVCALALTAAGCGSDDSKSDTSADSAKKTDTAMSDTSATTAGGGDAAAGGTLDANVGAGGDAFEITLKQDDKDVSSLKPGDYTIKVSDDSAIHNFHLTGPGVEESTTVDEKGTKEWKVTLKAGEYTYVCDPHESSMKGSFKVA